jgi:adenine phosphoribosyltransferase
MQWSYYDRLIGKTPHRYDVTPIFENPAVFQNLVRDLMSQISRIAFDKVVAIDSLGFILGAAIAIDQEKPLILLRKGGKLPYESSKIVRVSLKDYSETVKALEMRKGAVSRGDSILLADEWVETGSQVRAAIKILRKQQAKVVGIVAISADRNRKTKMLFEKYHLTTLNPGTYRRNRGGYGPV